MITKNSNLIISINASNFIRNIYSAFQGHDIPFFYNVKLHYSRPFNNKIECDINECGCRRNSFIWISHLLKTIYFEIPKAACTSIKRALDINPGSIHHKMRAVTEFCSKDGVKPIIKCRNIIAPARISIESKLSEEEFLRKSSINSVRTKGKFQFLMYAGTADEIVEEFSDYFTFAVIRDPIDRALSTYRMFFNSGIKKRNQQIKKHFGKSAKKMSFSQFLNSLSTHNNHHWNPFTNFLPSKPIDRIIKLEDLNSCWNDLQCAMGVNVELPHLNPTKKEIIETDDESIKELNRIYKNDFEYINNYYANKK